MDRVSSALGHDGDRVAHQHKSGRRLGCGSRAIRGGVLLRGLVHQESLLVGQVAREGDRAIRVGAESRAALQEDRAGAGDVGAERLGKQFFTAPGSTDLFLLTRLPRVARRKRVRLFRDAQASDLCIGAIGNNIITPRPSLFASGKVGELNGLGGGLHGEGVKAGSGVSGLHGSCKVAGSGLGFQNFMHDMCTVAVLSTRAMDAYRAAWLAILGRQQPGKVLRALVQQPRTSPDGERLARSGSMQGIPIGLLSTWGGRAQNRDA